MGLFKRKKKPAVKVPWWKKIKSPGELRLAQMFRVENAELIRLARPYKDHESKATKKNHIHKHRRSGSKCLKKYDRAQWNLLFAGGELFPEGKL